jgi:hypothetical protein
MHLVSFRENIERLLGRWLMVDPTMRRGGKKNL